MDDLAERRKKPGNKPGRRAGFGAGPVSGAKQIEATTRQARALTLRTAGANLQQIADELGYADASGAYHAIQSALKTILPEQERDEARRREIATLDRVQLAASQAAYAGDTQAQNVIIRCVMSRAKLLGLEAPVQVNLSAMDGDVVHINTLQALTPEGLAAARMLRSEMASLSHLRATAIDADPSE